MELCVAAILRPCAHEMRLQPGLVAQDKLKPPQDAPPDQSAAETPSEPAVTPENTAHSLMVTHVRVIVCFFSPNPPATHSSDIDSLTKRLSPSCSSSVTSSRGF